TMLENTPELSQRGQAVGKELETQLAEQDLEHPVGERERRRAGLVPVDAGGVLRARQCRGDREHAAVDVHPGNPPARSGVLDGHWCTRTRATRDIEHTVAALYTTPFHEIDSPRQGHRGHEESLVQLSRRPTELPSLRFDGHRHEPMKAAERI